MSDTQNPLPEPTSGGRYIRLPSGELQAVHTTEQPQGRVKREDDSTPAQPATDTNVQHEE
ncbi:MAG TPA: hypothetical protein VIL30_17970 [Ramlibacter sp.]|jgi:hypothetical protein